MILIDQFSSGEFSQVGVTIEEFTGKVWDLGFQPMLDKVRFSRAPSLMRLTWFSFNTLILFGLRYTQAVDLLSK